jgi:hypothetical protein
MIYLTRKAGGWWGMTAIGPVLWVFIGVLAVLVAAAIVVGSIMAARRLRMRRMVDPVEGTLMVTAGNGPAPHGVYSNYRLHGVVTAPGLEATPVQQRGIARAAKWPFPGRKLPVLVDRANPNRLHIRWDQVTTGDRAASEHTERLAQAMRGDGAALPPGVIPGQAQPPSVAWTGGGIEENATAVVTEVRDVPVPAGQAVPPGGAVELTLEITRSDGSRYTIRGGAMFSSPERRDRFGSVGARLPVRLNPSNPHQFVIDYGELNL